jgi:hypothetical protein
MFHGFLPKEPLCLLEAFLKPGGGFAEDIQFLFHEFKADDEKRADSATFYSVVTPEAGLRGVGLVPQRLTHRASH